MDVSTIDSSEAKNKVKEMLAALKIKGEGKDTMNKEMLDMMANLWYQTIMDTSDYELPVVGYDCNILDITHTKLDARGLAIIDQKLADIPVIEIDWGKTKIDLGEIKMGQKVTYRFIFQNKSKKKTSYRNIVYIHSLCGIEIPVWSADFGKEGYIQVDWELKELGQQEKSFRVYTNTSKKYQDFFIKVNVLH